MHRNVRGRGVADHHAIGRAWNFQGDGLVDTYLEWIPSAAGAATRAMPIAARNISRPSTSPMAAVQPTIGRKVMKG